MTRIRSELMKADERMRDLAPNVSQAYRKAEDAIGRPEEPAEETPTEAATAPEPAPGSTETPQAAEATPGPSA